MPDPRGPAPTDTHAAAAAVLLEGWRAMEPHDKAALLVGWSAAVRELAEAGVRRDHGPLDDGSRLIALGRRLYGPAVITADVERAVRQRR